MADQVPTAHELEGRVGHPGDLWQQLSSRIPDRAITIFSAVEADWLALMWSIDAFRTAGVSPSLMGREDIDEVLRLGAIYRMKGNWFATLISLLLQNQTHRPIAPRTKVRGFSQNHQIDVAWPARQDDPQVCVETKVSGAPPTPSVGPRGALSDFSNRRKELKFAATDLKLNRKQQETSITHWGDWRENAPPKTYFLWAARLRTEGVRPEKLAKLIDEATALRDSYLDGAALIAWRTNDQRSGYEPIPFPANARVTELDDSLYRIASVINRLTGPGGRPPEPVTPEHRVVDLRRLVSDT